ncbi:MAG: cysteine--tRNA ligase [Thermotogota bacterium]|nr:cysteine--tRNA ligase [Thermotogota bacterium]
MYVYNTLSRKKEPLKPKKSGLLTMYVCGPTVYGYVHLGNTRPSIVFDVFRRFLEYEGYRVLMAQNFTDIDDKIINVANENNMDSLEVAERFIIQYWKDAMSLGIRASNFHPRTTHFVKEIVNFIETLINKGHAYEADGDVYFDVSSFKEYGALSHRKVEDLKAGARIEPGEKKKSPEDFTLWKAAKPGEPSWESPWGNGRPGWHIECSVMSTETLGETFDIHAGGSDLIFPHHENENAQSEAKTGRTFARYWMHNGMMKLAGSKMSKSEGVFISIDEAVKKYGKDAIRLFILSKHYRSPIEYSEEMLEETKRAILRANRILRPFDTKLKGNPLLEKSERMNVYIKRFKEALCDDFNTPKVVSIIFELVKNIEDSEDEREMIEYSYLIRNEFGPILGILESSERNFSNVDGLIKLLIDLRNEYRENKQYKDADIIRDRLLELGINLMDGPQGTTYSF